MPTFIEECARCGKPKVFQNEKELVESFMVRDGEYLCDICDREDANE